MKEPWCIWRNLLIVYTFLFLTFHLAIVSLPHQTQRTLSLLREQDSLGRECEDTMINSINEFINKYEGNAGLKPSKEELEKLETGFKGCIFLSEERASLAQQMSLVVKDHLGKLEDDICSFEEEIRLARFHGEEEESKDEDSDTDSFSDSEVDEMQAEKVIYKKNYEQQQYQHQNGSKGEPLRKSKRRN